MVQLLKLMPLSSEVLHLKPSLVTFIFMDNNFFLLLWVPTIFKELVFQTFISDYVGLRLHNKVSIWFNYVLK